MRGDVVALRSRSSGCATPRAATGGEKLQLASWAAASSASARLLLFRTPWCSMAQLVLPLGELSETERLGAALAAVARRGDVIFLHGDLGAGKTALARGFLRHYFLNPDLDVTTPLKGCLSFHRSVCAGFLCYVLAGGQG